MKPNILSIAVKAALVASSLLLNHPTFGAARLATQDEINSLVSSTGKEHITKFAYFYVKPPQNSGVTYSDNCCWYIAHADNTSKAVYFLAPMENGNAGWGQIAKGADIAQINFSNHNITINSGITGLTPQDKYFDAGLNKDILKNTAYLMAQLIDGQTISSLWYFLYAPTQSDPKAWYIVNTPEYDRIYGLQSTMPLRFASDGTKTKYDWLTVDFGSNGSFETTWKRDFSNPNKIKLTLPPVVPTFGGLESDYSPPSNENKELILPYVSTATSNTTQTPSPTVAQECNSNTFNDVSNDPNYQPFYEHIEALCSAGIIVGYVNEMQSNSQLRPYKPGQIANYVEAFKVLNLSSNYDSTKQYCSQQSDSSQWYQCHLDLAIALNLSFPTNVTNPGYAITSQNVGMSMTRGDAFIYAAKVFFGQTTSGRYEAAQFLNSKGAIKDPGTTGYRENEFITRAELAALAVKTAKKAGKTLPYNNAPSSNLITNLQNPATHPDLPASSVPVTPVVTASTVNVDTLLNKAYGEVGKKGGLWTDGKWTYCARFVRIMYSKPGKYTDAGQMCDNFKNQGKLSTGTPTKGAAVCYSRASGNGYAGHIAIATGSNTEIGVTSLSKGVTEKPVTSQGSYIGYITPDNFNLYY